MNVYRFQNTGGNLPVVQKEMEDAHRGLYGAPIDFIPRAVVDVDGNLRTLGQRTQNIIIFRFGVRREHDFPVADARQVAVRFSPTSSTDLSVA